MADDDRFMRRCLFLAGLGAGKVAPNPMVGAVLVYQGKIIGEGFHEVYGEAHAEVNCIQKAEERLIAAPVTGLIIETMFANSTMYVSLEPCAHFGKTPPCADLIISKGIRKVVIGCRDPFPLVDGKGIEKLQHAGIEVTVGVLENECREINLRFFTFHAARRPYIVLKWAQSADRFISGGGQRSYISNEISNRLVHKWRNEEAAILVGTHTAILDNPSLTNRLWTGKNPVRVLIDRNLTVPADNAIFLSPERVYVFNNLKDASKRNLEFIKLHDNSPVALQIAASLHWLNIQSLLIEGGRETLQSFIDMQLWDEARIITATELLLQEGTPSPVLPAATLKRRQQLLNDEIKIYNRTN